MFSGKRERVAVIGGGAAGLGAAWRLAEKYDVTLYEAEAQLGGNAYAHAFGDTGVLVDMGVMITLPWAYPNLYCMFQKYGIETRAAAATLLVSFPDPQDPATEVTWSTDSPVPGEGFFGEHLEADASRFEQMMFEIAALPMNEQMEPIQRFLDAPYPGVPHSGRYTKRFLTQGLCPLLSLFLVTRDSLLRTPAWSLSMMFRFGTLSFFSPTTWRTITGGTREYIARLTRSFRARQLVSTKVVGVERSAREVRVRDERGGEEVYDHVVLATAANVALRLLGEGATQDERRVLGMYRYQPAIAYLHADPSLLSERFGPSFFFQYRSTNAAPGPNLDGVMTYSMKDAAGLQRHEGPVLVSVFSETPPTEPTPCFARREFSHLIADDVALKARMQMHALQGHKHTWFCGDYTTFSSHEDAFTSGMVIGEAFGVDYPFRDHPAAVFRYTQNRLMMMPRLGVRTRMGLGVRLELLSDTLAVAWPELRAKLRRRRETPGAVVEP
jgi:uncharacterized protein